jgi:hypothetical protein
MKRYGSLALLICVFLFFSCVRDELFCTISNNSSYPVSFKFYRVLTDEFTLQPGETKVYDGTGDATLKYFKVNGASQNEKRKQVEYRLSHRDAEFVDFSPMAVKIYNTLSIPVMLSADGYMGTDPMPIGANEIDQKNSIYIEAPIFTVTTDTYPVIADYEIKNSVMYITIR